MISLSSTISLFPSSRLFRTEQPNFFTGMVVLTPKCELPLPPKPPVMVCPFLPIYAHIRTFSYSKSSWRTSATCAPISLISIKVYALLYCFARERMIVGKSIGDIRLFLYLATILYGGSDISITVNAL